MPLELSFTCPLPHGMHARPASALEEIVRTIQSKILLTNQRNGQTADAKSVLAIIAADIRHDDQCRLDISGPDEQSARARLAFFLENELPHCDDALVPSNPSPIDTPIPRSLRATTANIRRGTPTVSGIGRGRLIRARTWRLPESIGQTGATSPAAEWNKLDAALATLQDEHARRLQRRTARVELDLVRAHSSIARDPGFRARLQAAVQQGRTAADAIADADAHFAQVLEASESALLRERALDIHDVCSQLLRHVHGDVAAERGIVLNEDSMVIADALTPGQMLALDRRFLKGLVLEHAGTTSHTVILARSFGIPTLTGVTGLTAAPRDHEPAIVDGEIGLMLTGLDETARRYYAMESRRIERHRERERAFAIRPATTADGHRLEIAANVSSAEESESSFAVGAEAIGLFRTELLFMDRDTPPTEEEQLEAYRQTLLVAAGRPVIIRTFDVGGDKPLPYLPLDAEDNPFLGFRAVRIYPKFEGLFRTQVRALIRASAHGRLQVMLPMIASLEEARWARHVIAEEQATCARNSVVFDRAMPAGAMIEVPSAAFLIDRLAQELDFFSIGSNDLLQCFVAADRANPRVAKLLDPLQPAFLRLLKKIVDDARTARKWIGLCGEMGAQTQCLPFLAGLGLDEISATPAAIPALKTELAAWSISACRELVDAALKCGTADDVRSLLRNHHPARGKVALLDPELILFDSESVTREEVIKEMTDQLYVLGRTNQPREVEEAIWQREDQYSTGFGYGFAIPHCQSNSVLANSLLVLKPRKPVPWGALDGLPVRVVILLAIRADAGANEHLKVLARLARLLTHENFRGAVEQATDPAALCEFLREQPVL